MDALPTGPEADQPRRRSTPPAPIPLSARENLTVQQTVELFGISRPTLYREAAKGRVTFRKLGRSTLVEVASVRCLLASLPTGTMKP